MQKEQNKFYKMLMIGSLVLAAMGILAFIFPIAYDVDFEEVIATGFTVLAFDDSYFYDWSITLMGVLAWMHLLACGALLSLNIISICTGKNKRKIAKITMFSVPICGLAYFLKGLITLIIEEFDPYLQTYVYIPFILIILLTVFVGFCLSKVKETAEEKELQQVETFGTESENKEREKIKKQAASGAAIEIAIQQAQEDMYPEDTFLGKKQRLEKKINDLQTKPLKKPNSFIMAFIVIATFTLLIVGIVLAFQEAEDNTYLIMALRFFIGALVLSLGSLPYAFISKIDKKNRETKLIELRDQLKKLKYVDEKAIKFYQTCQDYVTKKKLELNEVVGIVGQQFGKSTVEECKAYYYKGEAEIEKQKLVKEAEAIEREKERKVRELQEKKQKLAEAQRIAYYVGKEKYTAFIKDWITEAERMLNISKSMDNLSSLNASYRAPRSDWTIAGGIGSALGGAGLGLASAMNAQAENQKAAEYEAYKREKSKTQSDVAFDLKWCAENNIRTAQGYLDRFNDVLIDAQNIDEKFNMLSVTTKNIIIEDENSAKIWFKVEYLKKPTILKKPAILDGSLKIELFDEKENKIAEGYFVANGYNCFNYSEAGFQDKQYGFVDIPLPQNRSFTAEDLHCKITPVKMWIIEKHKNIINVEKSTIQQKIDEFKREESKLLRSSIIAM